MTQRIPLDHLTSNQYDALHQQLDQVRALRDDLRGITGARWIADALDTILDGRPTQEQPDPVHGCTIGGQPAMPILVSDYNQLVARANPELQQRLEAAIAALGKSETELAAFRATPTRVRALYEQWVKAGPPPLGTSTARWWDRRLVELHDAIQPPAPATPKEN